MATSETFLTRLRRRPRHERRILAVTTYIATSVIVLALWVSSFRTIIAPAPVALENASTPAPARDQSLPPSLAQLTTPFEALQEGIKNIIGSFQNLGREDRNPAAANETPLASSTTPLAEAPALATSLATPPPVLNPNTKRSPGLGEVLNQIQGEPNPTRTAGLLAAPAEQVPSATARGLGRELVRIIGDGLASLRRAVSTLYTSLTR